MDKFDEMTKSELMMLAKEHEIAGRSKMDKAELIKALSKITSAGKSKVVEADKTKTVAKKTAKPVAKKTTTKAVKTIADKTKKDAENKPKTPYRGVADGKNIRIYHSLPDFYDEDMIAFLPIEPERQFVYWGLSRFTQQQVNEKYGTNHCVVKIKNIEGRELAVQTVSMVGDWYFNLSAPLETVYAELGVIDDNGTYHSLFRSNRVLLPSGKVSDRTDERWILVEEKWQAIYGMSGVSEVHITIENGASLPPHTIKKVENFLASSK